MDTNWNPDLPCEEEVELWRAEAEWADPNWEKSQPQRGGFIGRTGNGAAPSHRDTLRIGVPTVRFHVGEFDGQIPITGRGLLIRHEMDSIAIDPTDAPAFQVQTRARRTMELEVLEPDIRLVLRQLRLGQTVQMDMTMPPDPDGNTQMRSYTLILTRIEVGNGNWSRDANMVLTVRIEARILEE